MINKWNPFWIGFINRIKRGRKRKINVIIYDPKYIQFVRIGEDEKAGVFSSAKEAKRK